MAGQISPSTQNLAVLKGFCIITRSSPVVDAAPVHLGKITDFIYTLNPTIIEYIDETQGIGVIADAAISQLSGSFKTTLSELTTVNVGIHDLGTPIYTGTYPRVPIFGTGPVYAQVELVGTNAKGPRVHRVMTNCLIAPDGDMNLISKEYATMPITGRHLQDQNGSYGYTDFLPDVNTIAPTNWTAPYITSDTTGGSPSVFAGGTPAYAAVTGPTVLTCNTGQWTGGQVTFAFQWYYNASNSNSGGSIITGATNQKYSPVSGNIGKYLYCTVATTNSISTTTLASGTTKAVHT